MSEANTTPDNVLEETYIINDIEIQRVDGSIICTTCGLAYSAHPQDPSVPIPTFVLLCDGTHAKV